MLVVVGLVPAGSDGSTSFFSLSLDSPEQLPHVFAFIVAYSFWQFWSAWMVQADEVRVFLINRVDVLITFGILIFAMLFYGLPYIEPLASTRIFGIPVSIWGSIIGAVLGSIIALLNSNFLRKMQRRSEDKLESDLQETLVNGTWTLIFNPNAKFHGKKVISFLPTGEVGVGANRNEQTWRIRDGLLEILNESGMVFSRFRFDKTARRWTHTNDDDTLSIRSQVIESGFREGLNKSAG